MELLLFVFGWPNATKNSSRSAFDSVESKKFTAGESTRLAYRRFCKFLFPRGVELIGKDYLNELTKRGPVAVLATHHHLIEPPLIQSESQTHIHWISTSHFPNYPRQTRQYYWKKLRLFGRIYSNLEFVEVDKQKFNFGVMKDLLSKGVKLLVGGKVVGSFLNGHSDFSKEVSKTYNLGHSSILVMIQEAEKVLSKKIPIILLSVNKVFGKFYAMQSVIFLPESFDRNKVANIFIQDLEHSYEWIEFFVSMQYRYKKYGTEPIKNFGFKLNQLVSTTGY